MHSCEVLSSGPEETAVLARSLAGTLSAGDVVLLAGELASGKTTFVTAVAKSLGYAGPVTSPTFTLANFYAAPSITVLHADTYRLPAAGAFTDLGLCDFMDDCVSLIEWGDLVAGEFACHLRIGLSALDPQQPSLRQITISSRCDRWTPVIGQLGRADLSVAG